MKAIFKVPTFICKGFLNKTADINLGKRSRICVEHSRTLLQRNLEFIGMIWNYFFLEPES